MQNLVITGCGQELISKLIAGTTTITFTKIAGSDHDYSDAVLEDLTEIEDVKQTALVSKVSRTNSAFVEVVAVLDNSELTEDYYIKALGLYAKDGDGTEILYGISIESAVPDYLPAFSGKTVSSITYRLITKVSNSEQVSLEVSPGAFPTIEQVEEINQTLEELKKTVSDGKSAVASAITGMGVSTAADDTFAKIAANILAITPTAATSGTVTGSWNGATFTYGGSATATANINGKNAKSASAAIANQTSVITTKAATNIVPGTSAQMAVASGSRMYFSGNLTVDSLGGNATASQVMIGSSFSSNSAGRNVAGAYTGVELNYGPSSVYVASPAQTGYSSSAFIWRIDSSSNSGVSSSEYNPTSLDPNYGYFANGVNCAWNFKWDSQFILDVISHLNYNGIILRMDDYERGSGSTPWVINATSYQRFDKSNFGYIRNFNSPSGHPFQGQIFVNIRTGIQLRIVQTNKDWWTQIGFTLRLF